MEVNSDMKTAFLFILFLKSKFLLHIKHIQLQRTSLLVTELYNITRINSNKHNGYII